MILPISQIIMCIRFSYTFHISILVKETLISKVFFIIGIYGNIPEILKVIRAPFCTLKIVTTLNLFSTAEQGNKFKHLYVKNAAAYLHNTHFWHIYLMCHLYWSHEKPIFFRYFYLLLAHISSLSDICMIIVFVFYQVKVYFRQETGKKLIVDYLM